MESWKDRKMEIEREQKGLREQRHRNKEAKVQRLAIMEAMGTRPLDMSRALGQSNMSTYNHRMEAYKKGYVQDLQDKMRDKVTSLAEERRIIAEACAKAIRKKTVDISKKTPSEIKLKEAEFALKALEGTEFSGKRAEPPKVEINIKDEATLQIQQSFSDIDKILERSGLNLDNL